MSGWHIRDKCEWFFLSFLYLSHYHCTQPPQQFKLRLICEIHGIYVGNILYGIYVSMCEWYLHCMWNLCKKQTHILSQINPLWDTCLTHLHFQCGSHVGSPYKTNISPIFTCYVGRYVLHNLCSWLITWKIVYISSFHTPWQSPQRHNHGC